MEKKSEINVNVMETIREKKEEKSRYQTPRLKVITIYAEQVLGTCKVPSPGNITCTQIAS